MASESQNSSTTKVLSWGKIEKYDSPLFPNSWRIGTIADGSCFFHAILTAIDKTYRDIKGDGIRGIAQSEKQQRVELKNKDKEKVENFIEVKEDVKHEYLTNLSLKLDNDSPSDE